MDDPYHYFKIEADEILEEMTRGLLHLEKNPSDLESIKNIFRYAHTLKGAASVVRLKDISRISHSMEDHLSRFRDQEVSPDQEDISFLLESLDKIFLLVQKLHMTKSPEDNELLPDPENFPDQPYEEAELPGPSWESMESEKSEGNASLPDRRKSSDTVRIDKGAMNKLTDFSNEMAINIIRLKTLVDSFRNTNRGVAKKDRIMEDFLEGLENGLEQAGFFSSEISDVVMDLRLVSIEESSYYFEKTVRDALVALEKEVDFVIKGKQVQIDRSLLAVITEPICHLLRNSVVHGAETREERNQKKKKGQAVVSLVFEKLNDRIKISIEDDGIGLDPDMIKDIAVSKKIIDPASAEKLSESEAMSLVLESGFSSAKNLTELAGRGVGLDVVKNSVAQLSGTLKIESVKHKFTRFILDLPLSINMIEAFLVEASGHHLLIPLQNIVETRLIKENQIETKTGKAVIRFGNYPIPLVNLSDILNIEKKKQLSAYKGVFIKCSQNSFALAVDDIKGKRKILLKPLTPSLETIDFVSAVTIIDNGIPAFVLNLDKIGGQLKKMPKIFDASSGGDAAKTILVVDDSLTTRTLISGILQGEKYDVSLAQSGEEALSILEKKEFDLILSDVEMPGINGFQLSGIVREDPKHGETPIIIISSLGSDSDKRKGIEVGANAYIVKGNFDQSVFLETIESLI